MKTRAVIIVVVLLLATLVAGVVLERNAFRLHTVVVTGCVDHDPAEVVAMAGLEYGESIFRFSLAHIREEVERNPYFVVQSVRRLLPDGLHIDVRERTAYAVIYYMGAIVCMDETGYILEVRQTLGDMQCPVILGLRMTAYQVGERVQSSDADQVPAMTRLLEGLLGQDALPLLSEIDLGDLQSIRMVTADGYSVDFGSLDKLDEKIQWIRAILPVLRQEGYSGGTINVASGKAASYLPGGVSSWTLPEDPDVPGDPGDPEDLGDPETGDPNGGTGGGD